MAKENQAVTSELTRLVAERDDSRRKLGDALHNQATAEQVCSCLTRMRIRERQRWNNGGGSCCHSACCVTKRKRDLHRFFTSIGVTD